LAHVRLWQGRTEDAVERSRDAVALFRRWGDPWGEVQGLHPLARGLVASGRVEEGLSVTEESLQIARGVSDPSLPFMSRTLAASVAVLVGRPENALRELEMTAEPAGLQEPEETQRGGWGAIALMQLGRPQEALQCIGRAPSESDERPQSRKSSDQPLVDAARGLALAGAGEPDAALEATATSLASTQATYHDRFLATIARGLAYARMGRDGEAEAAFDTVFEIVDETGDRLAQTLARLASAHALLRAGSPRGLGALSDARRRLDEYGVQSSAWEVAFSLAAGGDGAGGDDPGVVRSATELDGPTEGV
jgi:tetratricopeptide (TPR) repeat protein